MQKIKLQVVKDARNKAHKNFSGFSYEPRNNTQDTACSDWTPTMTGFRLNTFAAVAITFMMSLQLAASQRPISYSYASTMVHSRLSTALRPPSSTATETSTVPVPPAIWSNHTTVIAATASSFKPEPTQDGIVDGCLQYYQTRQGDSCINVVRGFHLTLNEFYSWNPALKGNCSGMLERYYYCVGGPQGTGSNATVTALPSHARPTVGRVPKGHPGGCHKRFRHRGESCD